MPELSAEQIKAVTDLSVVDPAAIALRDAFLACPLSRLQRPVVSAFIQTDQVADRLFEVVPTSENTFAAQTTEAYDELLAALKSGPDKTMQLVIKVTAIHAGEARVH